MRITVLNRGGLGVFGGHYDPHADEAIVTAREDETVSLTIEYPSAPTAPAVSDSSGISCTTPVVTSGTNKITAALSAIQDCGTVDISATVGGATKIVRIRGRAWTSIDRYDSAA
jgi:hypothetical protein